MSSGSKKVIKKRVAAAMYQVGTLEKYTHEDAKEVYGYPEFRKVYRRAKKNYAAALRAKVIHHKPNHNNAPTMSLNTILLQRELNKRSYRKPLSLKERVRQLKNLTK